MVQIGDRLAGGVVVKAVASTEGTEVTIRIPAAGVVEVPAYVEPESTQDVDEDLSPDEDEDEDPDDSESGWMA